MVKKYTLSRDRHEEENIWQAYTHYVTPLRKRAHYHTRSHEKVDVHNIIVPDENTFHAEVKVQRNRKKTEQNQAKSSWQKLSQLSEKDAFYDKKKTHRENEGCGIKNHSASNGFFLSIGVRRPGIDNFSWQRLERGKITPLRKLDLHGETAQIAFQKLHVFLLQAYRDGVRCVEIITGIGGGVEGGILKRELPAWLQRADLQAVILAAVYASPVNKGAVRLLLRRKDKMRSSSTYKKR